MRSIETAFLFRVEGATEIWFVRHGDCYEDMVEEVDPPLSVRGREQASRLAARLSRLPFQAVYCSPARRALETAHAITDSPRRDERLVEVATQLEDGQIQVAEGPEAALERMQAVVADAVAAHPGGRVILVGHGVAMMTYLCDVLRLEFGTLRVLPYYTSVSVVRILGDRRMVGSLGDVAHLEDIL